MINAVLTLGVISPAVHRGKYLPNLGNDMPLVCSYKGQHEIRTCVLMLHPSVAWLPLAKLGRFHFFALRLLPVQIGRFRVCPAAWPQPRLALILLLSGLPAPWVRSDQRDSNCATSEPGRFWDELASDH